MTDEKNGYPIDLTFPVGEATIYYYAPFFWSNGGDLVDESGLVVNGVFNSDQNVKTVSYFRSILENGYMSKVPIDHLFESGMRLWEKSKSFPSTYEAYDSIDVFQTDENYKELYYQLSTYGHPRPKTPAYPQVSTSFQQVLENSVLSGYDAREQLDKSAERINAKLKRYTLE